MNAVYGLIWEQWRQSRWVFGLSLLLLALYTSWLALMVRFESGIDADAAFGAWFIPILAMLLILPSHGLKALRMSLPPRLLVLPVSPATLVTVQLAFLCGMGLVLSGLTIAGIGLVAPLTGIPVFPVLLVLLGAAWGYFFMCCMTAHELPGALLRFMLVLVATYYALIRLFVWLEPDRSHAAESLWLGVFATGSLCVPWALSVVMVRRAKGGGRLWLQLPAVQLPSFRVDVRTPRYLAFLEEPRFRGMVWYEWRQTLVVLPALTAAGLFLSLLAGAYDSVLLHLIFFLTLPVAFGVGFYALRANEWYRGFQFVRPISTGRMAGAKLAAASLATLLNGAMAAGFMIVLFVLDAFSFRQGEVIFSLSAPVLWSWLGVLLATWVTLVIGRALLVAAGVVYVALIPYIVIHEGISDQAAQGVIVALIAMGLMLGALYVLNRRLVSVQVLWRGGALAGVLYLLVLLSLALDARAGGTPVLATHFEATLAIGLGLLPLLYLPILLRYQRHG